MWCRLFIYFSVYLASVICSPLPLKYELQRYSNIPEVQRLQEYLRIDTSRPENLEASTEFWQREAKNLGLNFTVHSPAGLPICVLTWIGTCPELQSIMLNFHTDVVAVEEAFWTYPPFSAHMDEKGDIYARGTQDTKSVGLQYLEAVRKMMLSGVRLKRTIHITVMPDEESGGTRGMIPFVHTEEFKSLNVGFALDEGMTSPDATLYATYLDKRPWQMEVTIKGPGGHSSSMPGTDIITKLQMLLNMTMSYRNEQLEVKNSRPFTDYGAYNTLQINVIKAGIATNVIPSQIQAIVDVRLSANASITDLEEKINSWATALGNDTEIKYLRKTDSSLPSPVDDSNPYWVAMQSAASELGLTLKAIVCPATSDMMYVRDVGIPALGFAPKLHMINRLHATDEYIPVDIYLQGIDIYVAMIKKVANV